MTFARWAIGASLSLGLLCGQAAQAQSTEPDAQRLQLAQQVIELTMDHGTFEAMVTPIVNLGAGAFVSEVKQNRSLTDAQVEAYRNGYRRAFLATYPKSVWLTAIAAPYAQRFSTQELTELLSFYQSATGKKLLGSLPQLIAEGNRIGEYVVQKRMTEFQQNLRQEIRNVQKN